MDEQTVRELIAGAIQPYRDMLRDYELRIARLEGLLPTREERIAMEDAARAEAEG